MKPVKQTKKTTTKTPARKATVKAAAIVNAAPVANGSPSDGKLAKPARVAPTMIEAHIDVGFGNQLFVRGHENHCSGGAWTQRPGNGLRWRPTN